MTSPAAHPHRAFRIVHVSADFPDSFEANKTKVIRTLRDLVADRFDQSVISLNRVSSGAGALLNLPRKAILSQREELTGETALSYSAPGKGIWHRTRLLKLGDELAELLARGPSPDLIVGHKLTVEGIAVARAAKLLDRPYAISIQGDTDTKILAKRPDLASTFAKVYHDAAVVFPFAPWAQVAIEEKLGRREGPSVMLPCPTSLETIIAPRRGDGRLVSAFHLQSMGRKNLAGLVAAAGKAAAGCREIHVDIIGGGSESDMQAAQAATGSSDRVTLRGRVEHEMLGQTFNRSTGFVLPSLRESFGLVFIEALFSGLPVAYPRGMAVSGFFDDAEFAIGIDAHDVDSIADAMQRLYRDEDRLKKKLVEWQNSPDARRFTRKQIGESFAGGLMMGLR